ncbi:MAG: branched-chain amino acid ABC transporter permease, partial [Burkholderiaceae bacterium]|nr:branched-chain amino acid ABC transporter permease [Burkholderiaceae bacterium]
MQANTVPATVWLLVALGALVAVLDGRAALQAGQLRKLGRIVLGHLAFPLGLAGALSALPLQALPLGVQAVLTLAIVVPMGQI